MNPRKTEVLCQYGVGNLPKLPYETNDNSLIYSNDNEIYLFCGGSQEWFILTDKGWKYHQHKLILKRHNSVAIKMPNAIYLIGGSLSSNTSEYLSSSWKTMHWKGWRIGPFFPPTMDTTEFRTIHDYVTDFDMSNHKFHKGIHANASGGHKISNEEFIVIRIRDILKCNVETRKWSKWYRLKEGRIEGCSMILDGKLIVTGGCNINTRNLVTCTEIMDLSTGKSWFGGNLNVGRVGFGMAFYYFEGKKRILAFGGKSEDCYGSQTVTLDSVEVWDDQSETWSVSPLQLGQKNSNFGYSTVPSKEFSRYIG